MSTVMPQIKNIVFLMLENRSLDNLLGWLYNGINPKNYYPSSNRSAYKGLIAGKYFNPAHSISGVQKYPVTPIPRQYQTERVPAYDPNEAMREGSGWNGVLNQLFGNQDIINAMPNKTRQAAMLGFLQDYYAKYMIEWQGLDILWSYTPSQLSQINSLARQYAVSDSWFSSVPTQTNPNRAFSLCGTSLGREANQNITAVEQFNIPTIFNVLAKAGKTWGLFYQDIWQKKQCYTEYTFPQISQASNGTINTIADFKIRARNGSLPEFTYLEPKWGYGKGAIYVQGNDYHPPTNVAPGDQFLQEIYTTLRTSPQWQNTLFIVTFDEHGGCFDHVTPPWGAINPDGIIGTRWGFNFELFGARVPTLLISPYIEPQTVFRQPDTSQFPYDHTSFIKTLCLWAGVDPQDAGLGKRVIAAPSFDAVLSNTRVNSGDSDVADYPIENDLFELENVPQATPPAAQSVNEIVAGLPFASVREILNQNSTPDDIKAAVKKFQDDPDTFESNLEQHLEDGV